MENLRKIFLSMDINGDGRLTMDELEKGLMGLENEKGMKEIMESVDTDHSGDIDYTGERVNDSG